MAIDSVIKFFDDVVQSEPGGWFSHSHRAATFLDAQRMATVGCTMPGDVVYVAAESAYYKVTSNGVTWDYVLDTATTDPVFAGPLPGYLDGFFVDGPMASAMGDIILYFAKSGDDYAGDGSFGSPMLSPEGCCAMLARRHKQTGEKLFGATLFECIDTTAQVYEPPAYLEIPVAHSGVILNICGSRQVLASTSTAGAHTATLIAGSSAKYDIAVDTPVAVTESTATGCSHWYEDTGLSAFYPLGNQVRGGLTLTGAASGNVRIPTPSFGNTVFGDLKFYPMLTTFAVNGQDFTTGAAGGYGSKHPGVLFRWTGLSIAQAAGTGATTEYTNTELSGCNINGFSRMTSSSALVLSHQMYILNFCTLTSPSQSDQEMVGCVLAKTVSVFAMQLSFRGCIFEQSAQLVSTRGATVLMSDFGNDYDSSPASGWVIANKSSYVEIFGTADHKINGTSKCIYRLSDGATLLRSGSPTFTVAGTLTEHSVKLDTGAKALNIEFLVSLGGHAPSDVEMRPGGFQFVLVALPRNDFGTATGVGTIAI